MSVDAYCEHAAGRRRPRDLHELLHGTTERQPYVPASADTVELEGLLVLEGDAAAEEIERFVAAQERAISEQLP